jgi:hypothetical protein
VASKATIFGGSFVRAEARTLQGSDLLSISALRAGGFVCLRSLARGAVRRLLLLPEHLQGLLAQRAEAGYPAGCGGQHSRS